MSEPRAPYTADMLGEPTPADVSLTDQIACIEREIRMRERVYPRWVESKRMTQTKADHEILVMRAVLDSLKRQEIALELLKDSFFEADMSYCVQAVDQAHRVLQGGMIPRAAACDQEMEGP